ncbi:adenylosuccinate lyase family protein [uncultured Microbacterium sp.]|uniref:class-II fumarase/aspartase family protein n=1 Tax=uncultured Microbacterium sp. TaxID=191216 RepID=UPI0035C9B6AB
MKPPPPSSHLTDSRVLGGLFSSERVQGLFTDEAMVRSWLQAEVGLATAQAELGVIPPEAAVDIARAASDHDFDLDELGKDVAFTAHPCISVIRELAAASRDGEPYVHLGATTQDITDTGLVLQCKAAIAVIEEQLGTVQVVLRDLAERYRDLPMVGRTHAQHALPITLGLKFAVLLTEFQRHEQRVRELKPRVLVGQLGGAVGSLAAFGDRGIDILERMMAHLDLEVPVTPWHTSRDGFTELVSVLAMISASCGKIANEIRVLQRTEVAELEEPFVDGKVGSSTMPHKKNPMYAEFIIANAILAREKPAGMLTAMMQEHERDMTMWGVEWTVIPDAFTLASGLLDKTNFLLSGLIVHRENIHKNLHQLGDLMLSEVAMMALSKGLGKVEAHDLVYAAAMQSWSTGQSLIGSLVQQDGFAQAGVTAAELSRLLVPENYTGLSGELVDRALRAAS